MKTIQKSFSLLWRTLLLTALLLSLLPTPVGAAPRPAQNSATQQTLAPCTALTDPDQIPSATLINFDDIPDATTIGDTYRALYGVRFEDGKEQRAITYGDRSVDPTKARSAPNVTTNSAIHPNTSANRPMRIAFDKPMAHVGFWMGNGESQNVQATLTAYDGNGNAICDLTYRPVPESYSHFMGIYDSQGRIASVSLDYGNVVLSESIDDLIFSQDTSRPLPAPVCQGFYSPTEIPNPTLINFDDLDDATTIGDSYRAAHGVRFDDTNTTHAIIYADRASDVGKSYSRPNVATNSAKSPETSSGVPMVIRFDADQGYVGMRPGNGKGASGEGPDLTGVLRAYDRAGNFLCQVEMQNVPASHPSFLGIYDSQNRIARVELDYGDSLLSESIDDLTFSQIQQQPTPTPSPMPTPEIPLPESPLHNGKDRVNIEVKQNDLQGYAAQVSFPEPQMWPVTGPEGERFVEMGIPGMEQGSLAPGLPNVPLYSQLLAVPKGAKAYLKIGDIPGESQRVYEDILLYPVQNEAADIPESVAPQQGEDDTFPIDDFRNPPFVLDKEAYSSDGYFPAEPVTVEHLGSMRGLDLMRITVATGRYNPAKQVLELYQDVNVQVQFEGGEDYFLTSRDMNPFNRQNTGIYEMVLNAELLPKYIFEFDISKLRCIGHEYLIITDPDFRTAADTLRTWKVAKGISTRVVETGNDAGDAGTTRNEIQDFIQGRYDNCIVRPSYVLLLGDAEHITPFYRTISWSIGSDLAATDLDYALMDNADIMPDLAVGRIPVDTLAEAETVINKIVSYEQTPPFNPSFYRNMAFAGYFQCCRDDVAQDGTASRSFIETAELVRDEMLTEGYTVSRIYTSDDDYHDDATKSGYYNASTRSTTPNRYYNGSLLPADLRSGSGFAWDGDTNDVVDAFNDGNFLIFHRDHGYINGWGDPDFDTWDLASLNNGGLTPVVYSINCASGLFDNETRNPANDVYTYNTTNNGVYWAESLLRMEGGAVGIIGDTRNSPSWANSALARGLFDATWTDTVPEGGNVAITRLGDILNYGKSYLVGQVGVAQTAGSVSTNSANMDVIMYHVFGDPTMEMWTSNPRRIILPPFLIPIEFKPTFGTVRYPVNGAIITALRDGEPVGRGMVQDGVARMDFFSKPDPEKPLSFSASLPGALSTPLKLDRASGEVNPEQGGTVRNEDKTFEISFPPKAVERPVQVSYTNLFTPTQDLPEGFYPFRSFKMGAEDEEGTPVRKFASPYSMSVCLAEGANKPESEPVLAFFDEADSVWTPIDSKWDGRCAVAELDHFTEFALLADDPGSLGGGSTTFSIFLPGVQK